jgi:hypothetical protein
MQPLRMLPVLPFLLALLFSSNSNAWSVVEDFNSGTDGQSVMETGAMDDAAGGTLHSASPSLDGSLSAKMSISGGTTGFGSWGGIINFPSSLGSGDSYWVQFYMYIPSSFYISTPTNGSLKFLRVRTKTAEGPMGGFNDFQIIDDGSEADSVYRYIKEGVENRGDRGWLKIGSADERSTLLPRDQWFKVELALSFGVIPLAEGGNSYVRAWVNDDLIWNGANAQTLSESGDTANALYMFTYWNGEAPKTQSLYIDNLIMTSDIPSNRDQQGFPYIGNRGGGQQPSLYSPPVSVKDFRVE